MDPGIFYETWLILLDPRIHQNPLFSLVTDGVRTLGVSLFPVDFLSIRFMNQVHFEQRSSAKTFFAFLFLTLSLTYSTIEHRDKLVGSSRRMKMYKRLRMYEYSHIHYIGSFSQKKWLLIW